MTAEPPAPIAEGHLAQTPFAHVLLYLYQKGLTGTLVVWPEPGQTASQGQDRIRIEDGKPVAARLLASSPSLDSGMLPLFTRLDAPYAFYDVDLVGAGPGTVSGRVHPLSLLAASLRGAARQDVIDSILGRFDGSAVRLLPGANLSDFRLDAREKRFIDLLRAGPATVQELVQNSGDERSARRLLYLLAVTRGIEAFTPVEEPTESVEPEPAPSLPVPSVPSAAPLPTISTGPPPSAVASMPPPPSAPPAAARSQRPSFAPQRRNENAAPDPVPPPPKGLPSDLAKRWREIADRSAAIEKQDYYVMLDVARDAGEQTVRDCYFELAKKWHPDRLPPRLKELRPWVDRIFHHMTRAKDTLMDVDSRGEYLKSVQAGGGTPESDREVARIVEAAMEFRRAEIMVKRRDWDGALAQIAVAMELNSEDPDFHATEAWVLLQKHGLPGPVAEMHSAADRALALNPNHEKGNLYKAMILKREGHMKRALEHFKKVADKNPRNIDAVREVRLANMRQEKPASEDGLFSKLFGKKK